MAVRVRDQIKQNGFIDIRLTSLKWQSDEHSVAKADELYKHLEAN